jgi:hypothetical protein
VMYYILWYNASQVMIVVLNPLYSRDLATCSCSLFPKLNMEP